MRKTMNMRNCDRDKGDKIWMKIEMMDTPAYKLKVYCDSPSKKRKQRKLQNKGPLGYSCLLFSPINWHANVLKIVLYRLWRLLYHFFVSFGEKKKVTY
ncbi:hypothetical protein P8452_57294 [Trifolium repens]|nr:hypothetical protein P8452_57294 [Trifolium repens]